MKKQDAESEKEKYNTLLNAILVHNKYNARMRIVEMGVEQTCSKGNNFYVYCKLKGKLGNVTESLDYVLKNYSAPKE